MIRRAPVLVALASVTFTAQALAEAEGEDGIPYHMGTAPSPYPEARHVQIDSGLGNVYLVGSVRQGDAVARIGFTGTSESSLLYAWADFDRDGDWGSEELVIDALALPISPRVIELPLPPKLSADPVWIRLRTSTLPLGSPGGLAFDGDVKDLQIELERDVVYGGPRVVNRAYGPVLQRGGIHVADLDGDGRAEIVAVGNIGRSGEEEGAFSVHHPAVGGGYTVESVRVSEGFPTRSACGDLDGDGIADLVISTIEPTRLVWFRFEEGSGFLEREIDREGSPVESITVGDLDGNGSPDVLSSSTGTFRLWEAGPAGVFGARSLSLPFSSTHLATADFDGDGDADVFAGPAPRIYLNSGDLEFERQDIAGVPFSSNLPANNSTYVGDFDGDGDLDLAFANGLGLYDLRNDGGGTFSASGISSFDRSGVVAGDLDGDGDLDLAARNGSFIRSYENVQGQFGLGRLGLQLPSADTALAVGDVAGDEGIDLVASWAGGFQIFENTRYFYEIDLRRGAASREGRSGFIPVNRFGDPDRESSVVIELAGTGQYPAEPGVDTLETELQVDFGVGETSTVATVSVLEDIDLDAGEDESLLLRVRRTAGVSGSLGALFGIDGERSDTDGDTVAREYELGVTGTSSSNPDSDGDGVDDGGEILAGTNPLVADEFDFGDAFPHGPVGRAGRRGAAHLATGAMLGISRDAETGFTVFSPGSSDDDSGQDDEDGVSLVGALSINQATGSVEVEVSGAGAGARLSAWIDFDGDTVWDDRDERVASDQLLTDGVHTLVFSYPPDAMPGEVAARFRLSSVTGLPWWGAAPDGEVEDYLFELSGSVGGPISGQLNVAYEGSLPSMQAVDFEGDGDIDLFGKGGLLENEGGGEFVLRSLELPRLGEFLPADFDGDGAVDVATLVGASAVWLDITDPVEIREYPVFPPFEIDDLLLAEDIDSDGDVDLVALRSFSITNELVVFDNDGAGAFDARRLGTTSGEPNLAVVLDVDGDGRLDLVASRWNSSQLQVFWDVGGRFREWGDSSLIALPGAVTIAGRGDIDGDGDADLIAKGSGSLVHMWLENEHPALTFSPHVIGGGINSFSLNDIDRDGDLDLLTAHSSDLIQYENDGAGGFSRRVLASGGPFWLGVDVADIDLDGIDDLLARRGSGAYWVRWVGQAIAFDVAQLSLLEGDVPRLDTSVTLRRWGQIESGLEIGLELVGDRPSPIGLDDVTIPDAVFFLPGQSEITVPIQIQGDRTFEADETGELRLVGLPEGLWSGTPAGLGVELINDESDSDGDGLSDFEEVNVYSTDLAAVDTDGDGVWDGAEAMLGNDPATPEEYDFGDAPPSYPTGSSEAGAAHRAQGPRLGSTRDSESGGQPSLGADGDGADEDGVVPVGALRLSAPSAITIDVADAPVGAWLDAWVDFNSNGTWADPGERIAFDLPLAEGENVLWVSVPNWARVGSAVARFRLSGAPGALPPGGAADDGEVEDHLLPLIGGGGTGRFFPVPSGAGRPMSAVATADVNGDGLQDIVGGAGQLFWIEQQDGRFDRVNEIGQPFGGSSAFNHLTMISPGDLDGDGDVDFAGIIRNLAQVFWLENDGGMLVRRDIADDVFSPKAIAIGDLDGDGDQEIVTSDSREDSILMFENFGSGEFASESAISEGFADDLTAIELVDLDADGDLDILSASEDDGRVAWFENDGVAGFSEHSITAGAQGVRALANADFDGDGDIDIAYGAGQFGSVVLTLLENDGNQSFTMRTIAGGLSSVTAVTAVDFNGDGMMDLVTTDSDGAEWFRNLGGIQFERSRLFSDVWTTAFAVSDLDGDGAFDLLASSGTSAAAGEPLRYVQARSVYRIVGDTINIPEGDGPATPVPLTVERSGEVGEASRVRVGLSSPDVPDVLPEVDFSPSQLDLEFLPGQTSSSFEVSIRGDLDLEPDFEIAVALSPLASNEAVEPDGAERLIVVSDDDREDEDGDGLSDKLEVSLGTDPARVDTDGDGVDDFSEVRVGTSPTAIESFDFGDAASPSSAVTAHRVGGPWLGTAPDAEAGAQPDDNAEGLADEDGVMVGVLRPGASAILDLSAGVPGKLDAWFDYNRDGIFSSPSEQVADGLELAEGFNGLNISIPPSVSTGEVAARFRISEAGGFGSSGIAPDGEIEDYVFPFAAPFGGAFEAPSALAAFEGRQQVIGLTAADLDRDGDVDLLYRGAGQYKFAENLGAFEFAHPRVIFESWAPLVATFDYDGDGDLDLVTADHEIIWWENAEFGSFSPHPILDLQGNSTSVQTVDFDGDSDLDFVVASDSAIHVYESTPGGFARRLAVATEAGELLANPIDFDGDGDLDLVAGKRETDSIELYTNRGLGTPFERSIVATGIGGLVEVAVADLDGDADFDVLPSGADFGWIKNGGGGLEYELLEEGAGTGRVKFADLDGNGLLDLVASRNGGVRVLWQREPGVISTPEGLTFSRRDELAIGDFNGDGAIDIATSERSSLEISALANVASSVTFLPTDGAVTEGDGHSEIEVARILRAGNVEAAASVVVEFAAGPVHPAFGGSDYSGDPRTVTFEPGQTEVSLSLRVFGDLRPEPDESLVLSLRAAEGARLIGDTELVVTLVNDDFDSDLDGLGDREESLLYGTDPANADTDGDGIGDGREVGFGSDPAIRDATDRGDTPGREGACIATGPTLGYYRDVDGEPFSPGDGIQGDDFNGIDDDDGVRLLNVLYPGFSGGQVEIEVRQTGSGAFVSGWVDFDGDGAWSGDGERILPPTGVSEGATVHSFAVPAWALPGPKVARFRVSSQAVVCPLAPAADGEIEDYEVRVATAAPSPRGGLLQRQIPEIEGDTAPIADDFDGDGRTDLLTARSGAHRVTLFRQTDGGGWGEQIVGLAFQAAEPVAADLDRDGELEVLVRAGGLGVRIFDAPLEYGEPRRLFEDSAITSFRLVDVETDGDIDLVSIGWLGGVRGLLVATNHGDGSFAEPYRLVPYGCTGEVDVGDANGDGLPDLLTWRPTADGSELVWIENRGSLGFATHVVAVVDGDPSGLPYFVDLNDDSRDEIAVGSSQATPTLVYILEEGGGFSEATLAPFGIPSVRQADLDGDGLRDLTTPLSKVLYRSADEPGFGYSEHPLPSNMPGVPAVGDFDSDGDLDLIASNGSAILATNADFLVTTTAADGAGSLREQLQAANAAGGGRIRFDPVVFSSPQTILLGGAPFDIAGTIAIDPPVPLTLDAAGMSQVFRVTSSGRGAVRLENLTLRDGAGAEGGAIHVGGNSPRLRLISLRFENCTAAAYGGAVAIESGGVEFEGCDFIANSADGGVGGAIRVGGSALASFSSCQFHENAAQAGGGLSVAGGVTATNCSWHSNSATRGGAIRVEPDGRLRLVHCTIASNGADIAGGIDILGVLELEQSIVAQNEGVPADISGAVRTDSKNLVGDGTGATGLLPGPLIGTTAAEVDAGLPLFEAGGERPRWGLLRSSPARGEASVRLEKLDANKSLRYHGGSPSGDLGAYEAGGVTYAAWGGVEFADPEADPDQDGLPNGVEYFLGTDPGAPNGWPISLAADSNSLEISRSPDVDGEMVEFEWSSDLANWTSQGLSRSVVRVSPDAVVERLLVPGAAPHGFLRIRSSVSLP